MKLLRGTAERSGKCIKVIGSDPVTFRFKYELQPGDLITLKSVNPVDLYSDIPGIKVIDQTFIYQGNGFFKYKAYQRCIDEPEKDFYRSSLLFFFRDGYTFEVIETRATRATKALPNKKGRSVKTSQTN